MQQITGKIKFFLLDYAIKIIYIKDMNIATIKPEKKVKINISVNEDTLEKIKKLAVEQELTCSGAISYLIKEYLHNISVEDIQDTEIPKPTVNVNSVISPGLCKYLHSIKDVNTFTRITGMAVQNIVENVIAV